MVLADLKSCPSSTWTQDALRWLEDKRDICIFGEQENSFSSADLQKILDASLFSRKFPQARSFSKKVWVEKEVDAHVSTRSKLMQKRKIDTHVDVQADVETYTRSKLMQRYKIDVHVVVQAGVYIKVDAET